jgi:hypothetical protein
VLSRRSGLGDEPVRVRPTEGSDYGNVHLQAWRIEGVHQLPRRVFYSFHHKADAWRASQVRNAGVVEGNRPVSDNDWEAIKRGGETAIKRWIGSQLWGKSCVVVLIGSATAGRKWIKYEIREAWAEGKGLVGVYIHNLKDRQGNRSAKGRNPFDDLTLERKPLSSIVRAYDPGGLFTDAYRDIKNNLAWWIEEAIEIRLKH